MVKFLKLAGVVVFVIIAIAGAGVFRVTEASKNPSYCGGCHVTDPYVASTTSPTRLAAVHTQAGVTCQECHPQTTATLVGEIANNITHQYSTPLDKIKFDTQACLQCHGTYAQLRTANPEIWPAIRTIRTRVNWIVVIATGSTPDSIYYCGQCHGDATMPTAGWVLP